MDETLFVRSLTTAQPGVYAYILSLLPDSHAAADVLQETNVRLWQERERFEPGTNFLAWAVRIAYFEVLSYRKRKKRSKLFFDDSLLASLSEQLQMGSEQFELRLAAMRNCLAALPDKQQELLRQRYSGDRSVRALADARGLPVKTVYQSLYRAREALSACVRRRLGLKNEGTS